MSANNDEGIVIPSIFVGETTGKIILYNYLFTDQFVLVINDDLPFNINTHLILPFTIVVGLCFIIMIGFMIVKCVREQRRLRRHRLPSSMLKKIPSIRFSKGQQSESYDTCAICLEDYGEGDKLRILPCSHGECLSLSVLYIYSEVAQWFNWIFLPIFLLFFFVFIQHITALASIHG